MNAERISDARIPPTGAIPQAARMFRVNWIAAEVRSPTGVPMLSPDYVASLGRNARVLDLRTPDELTGPLGYIPGSVWVPEDEVEARLSACDPFEATVLVSRGGERAGRVAKVMEGRGHGLVAALMGGIVAWRQAGYSTLRDPAVLARGPLAPLGEVWESQRRALTADDIRAQVGDPRALRRIKVAAMLVNGRLCCVDGRAESGLVGTPGGDAGEFLVAAASLEALTGTRLTERQLREMLLRRLDAFGRFYLHTDVHASNEMIRSMREDRRLDEALSKVFEPLEWRRFLRAPPAPVREIVLEHMLAGPKLGCGHVRLALQRSDDYGVRAELVRDLLRAFFLLRWEGVEENEVGVLPGGHAEGAVVNVLIEGGAEAYARIPLVSPMVGGSQVFLQHPQVAVFLRGQVARLLTRARAFGLSEAREGELLAHMNELASRQLGHTLRALAPGLPVFDVLFCDDDRVEVEARGLVPG